MFEDIKVIGEYFPEEIAEKLQQMDDPDTANKFLERASESKEFFGEQLQPWEYATHQFGYIRPVGK